MQRPRCASCTYATDFGTSREKVAMVRLYVKRPRRWVGVGWICPSCGRAVIDARLPLKEYRTVEGPSHGGSRDFDEWYRGELRGCAEMNLRYAEEVMRAMEADPSLKGLFAGEVEGALKRAEGWIERLRPLDAAEAEGLSAELRRLRERLQPFSPSG